MIEAMMGEEVSLPSSEASEKSVLSLMLQDSEDNGTIGVISSLGITAEHFYNPVRSKLFDTILERSRGGLGIDLITLTQALADSRELEGMGGAAGLCELYGFSSTTQVLHSHCHVLIEKLAQRKAVIHAMAIQEAALNAKTPEELKAAISAAGEDLSSVINLSSRTDSANEACMKFADSYKVALDNGGIAGIPTNIPELDRYMGGLRKQDLWVVTAYPSGGKSVMMKQIAYNVAVQGKKVAYFTLEVSTEDVIAGMISYSQEVHAEDVFQPKNPSKGVLQKIKRGITDIRDLNIIFCDKDNLSMDIIEAECDRMVGGGDIDLVVIDYYQIISHSKDKQLEGLEMISNRLKQLAKRLKCTVLTGSQLNDDGKIKGARKLGEDANVALNILPDGDGIYIAKNRNGQRDVTVPLALNGAYQRFNTINNNQQ